MKNNIRSLIFAGALLFGGHSAFAQSVEVFNQTICRGVSVNLNGTLYKVNGGYTVTSVTADNLPGKELVNEPRVTPQQTTVYTIKSATLAGVAQPDAKVTVTVHNRPTLSIEFVNESSAVSDGMVCEGTNLQFKVKTSGNLNGNPVTWYVSSLDQPFAGNNLSFAAKRTCEVTALANNGYCPITDTTIRVRVFTPPTPGDVDVVWNTEWKGDYCQGCGFFPDLKDILKSGGDEVVYENSTIVWADGGGTNEKTLSVGGNVFRFRIHYEVRRHNRCGDVSMQYDTVVDLRLTSVKDCKPEISSSYVTVRPCESARISLTNRYAGTLQLKGSGVLEPQMEDLSASPVAGEWSLTRTGPISQVGNELYTWEVLLQKYTAPKTWAGFKVSGTAKMSCPYSKTEPVKTVNYSMNLSVRLDTSYLSAKFDYCPSQEGRLEIGVPEQIGGVNPAVTLNSVDFLQPAGVLGRLNPYELKVSKYVYTTKVPVGGSNVADFLPLTVRAVYDVKVVKGSLNCQFRQTEEKKVESTPRSDCEISFGLPNSETCIGVPKTLIISGGNGGNITVTNITIDNKGSLAMNVEDFQPIDNGGKLTFYPYYAGAPGVTNKKDTITATATYRMSGSTQELQWTKQFEVKMKSCGPELRSYGSDCSKCLNCPGTKGRMVLDFKNPTTDTEKCRVDWYTEPSTSLSENRWNTAEGISKNVTAIYYTDTKLEQISVVYNEGDSVYTCKVAQLTGGNKLQDFKVDPACAPKVKPDQDTCCLKDEIEADIINGNTSVVDKKPRSQFQQLIWDPSVIQYVAEDSRNLTTEQNLQSSNKGYRVRVVAYEKGIYPFKVVSKVGDTLITYADTLRLTVFGRPRAFIQDTVYACLKQNLDLGKYVDNTMVKKIGSSVPTDLHHFVPNTEDPQTIYAYQIEMSGKCLSLAPSNVLAKDSMVVIAADPVYISTINDEEHCPGDEFNLQAPTNGTTIWYRQKKYPSGGYGAREVVASGWPGNKNLQVTMGSDTVLYTIEAHTACPDNGEASVSFSVSPKPGPKISIQNVVACGSETVTLKADYDADKAGSLKWKADGKPVASPYVVKSPDPSGPYTMKVEGTVTGTIAGVNDCPSSATAEIRFLSSPIVAIQGKNSTGTICVDSGVSVRIQAQGDASNDYAWYLKTTSTGTQIGTGTTVLNRAFQQDTLVYVVASNGGICTAADSARIVLNGKKRPVADTTVCVGSAFSFYMPEQEGVSYKWYLPDGKFYCPCRDISFTEDEPFAATDEGTYKVEIIRNGCTVTQNIDIKGFPVPVMDFGTTEDPVRFCAGSPLVLNLHPKIDGKEVPGYFVWTDPAGTVDGGDGKTTYVKNPVLMVDKGVYTVAVTLQNGCTHSASVNVRVDDHTQPDFSLKPYYCEGETVDLNAVYQGDGSTYEWFSESGRHFGPAADLHKASLSDLTPKESGRLYLVVARGACKDTTYRNLEVRERPIAEVEVHGGSVMDGVLFFCEGQSVLLALKNVLPGDTTRWILPNGDILLNAEDWHANKVALSDKGEYSVEVVRNGCASEVETVNLDVRVVPVLILQDTFLCQGRDIVVNVENTDYPGAVYTWYEFSMQAPEMRLERGGEYHIIMSLQGCSDEGSFRLSERPVPEWDFPADTSICNRDSLLLQGPEGMDSYQWQDGSRHRWFLVKEGGLYTLTVTHAGCANEESVYVETEFCTPVFFPSAFTPNGDGINDAFGPISLAEEGELEYAFFVYNANGQLMFQSTDIRSSWDGTFKGKPCPAGIYTYRCKIVVTESGRDISRTGTVHLIR